jgi:hypothetical protein
MGPESALLRGSVLCVACVLCVSQMRVSLGARAAARAARAAQWVCVGLGESAHRAEQLVGRHSDH